MLRNETGIFGYAVYPIAAGGSGGGARGRGGAESGSGGGAGLDGRGGRGGGVVEAGIGMGSAGTGGIGGKSGTDSAAGSDMAEHELFSDIDTGVTMSSVLLHSVAGADDRAMFSSSDVVRSMASQSSLPTADLLSSANTTN